MCHDILCQVAALLFFFETISEDGKKGHGHCQSLRRERTLQPKSPEMVQLPEMRGCSSVPLYQPRDIGAGVVGL